MKTSFELGFNKIAKTFEEEQFNCINNVSYFVLLVIFVFFQNIVRVNKKN